MASSTIKDIARIAKVSVGTVSMALNEKPGVNEETRKKILAIAEELNYKPNLYARYLTNQKTNLIGLIVTDITNPFFGNMIDMIQKNLDKHGYDTMLGISRGSVSEEKKIIQKFIDMQVGGVIAVPSHNPMPDLKHYQALLKQNIFCYFVTSYYPNIDIPCIMTDLSDGAYQLVRYLLDTGHRQIVYITGNLSVPVSSLRVNGYISAYREAGLSYQEDWIIPAEVTLEGGYTATEQILQNLKPDAIITVNDFMAMGVLKCLKEHNLKVPEDISVAGYDDLVYTSMLETPLTTVHQPLDQICQRVVTTFLEQQSGQNNTIEKVLLKPHLVIRESSKPR